MFRRSCSIVLVWLLLAPPAALANPAGGVVRAGDASITGQGTPLVQIHQRSANAVLSWQKFNIQPGETTRFQQPGASAVALNRILDGQASQILGSLHGNGHVYLINPNGIVFGHGATVDVHALTASTSLDAENLRRAGGYDPSAVSAPGARIENYGTIRTDDGGSVYLIAPIVQNGPTGVIVAPNGQVELAAGATAYLTDKPDGLGLAIKYTAPGAPGGAAVNLGQLISDGGLVRLRAAIVQQNGVVEANAVRERAGRIELYADASATLGAGSVTAARGDDTAISAGGAVTVSSGGNATVEEGALVDASGGTSGGAGGRIEVSAADTARLSGTFRSEGHGGAAGGEVVIDPNDVEIVGTQTVQGASTVKVTANQNITLTDGATVALSNPTGTPTYALHSGGDVVFGSGAKITDAGSTGTPVDETNHWDVQIVAGATDLTESGLDPGTKSDKAAGGVYLSGGTGAVGALQPGTNDGEVSLTRGDLTVRAAGDVVVGSGGGLKDVHGNIDVEAGRDVLFHATSQARDSVIENGSGSIRVVAGDSVRLRTPGDVGNAAIRTRGVKDDPDFPTTQSRSGDILVYAKNGDVDAGVANRWVQPGPNYGPEEAAKFGTPDLPAFDALPVARDGILGIGSEAGGDVVVVAAGNVTTRDPEVAHGGGTASNLGTTYDGSHIGVFGRPVSYAKDTFNQSAIDPAGFGLDPNDPASGPQRPVPIADAPESQLVVVAGGNITGDYMARYGTATLRAGYGLTGDPAPADLGAASVLARLADPQQSAPSDAALGDASRGWVGTLGIPITVDLGEASADLRALNGIAVRAIENPSLVYPTLVRDGGEYASPTYRPTDSARLEAERGDVILVGNEIKLPTSTAGSVFGLADDPLVLLLPPSLTVQTHAFTRTLSAETGATETRSGDFVLLAPFEMAPSARGGLTLDVAGTVREAEGAVSTSANLIVGGKTTGAAKDLAFTLRAGTRLVDPATGLEYTLNSAVSFDRRLDANPAGASGGASVVFTATPQAAQGAVPIPAGTRVVGSNGQLYETLIDAVIPAPSDRPAVGQVVFTAPGPVARDTVLPSDTPIQFQTPDGRIYQVTGGVTIPRGKTSVVANVIALDPGSDARPFDLTLVTPIPGIAQATNYRATSRPPQIAVAIRAVEAGTVGNIRARRIATLVTPVPGIQSVLNPTDITDGNDTLTFGAPNTPGAITATASVPGPAGRLAQDHVLVVADPSALPAGVSPSDVQFSASVNSGGEISSMVFKALPTDAAGHVVATRPDPTPDRIPVVTPAMVWRGAGTSGTGIHQSDADPTHDARSVFDGFDYAAYYRGCHTGVSCGLGNPNIDPVMGAVGPTHIGDLVPASLRAAQGFHGVSFDLAEAIDLWSGADLVDVTLRAQQSSSTDVSTIDVSNGNVRLGVDPTTKLDEATGLFVSVPPDGSSSIQIAGPGRARLLVGVESFAEAEAALVGAPGHVAGRISQSEFHGSAEAFDGLDRRGTGIALGYLTADRAPWVPTGSGGSIDLTDVRGTATIGVQTVGNILNPGLPDAGAALDVISGGDVRLNRYGSIGTFQGGDLSIESVAGSVFGGNPGPGAGQRGIFSTRVSVPGGGAPVFVSSGGGNIRVDVSSEFDLQGNALVSASGGNIRVVSRNGSINGGVSVPFANPAVNRDPFTVIFTYTGGGISAAPPGTVSLEAAKKVFIGAGITGSGITIKATDVVGGTGAVSSSGTLSIEASGTVSGSFNASGAISVTGGGTTSGASLSSASIVSGAGPSASNTGGGKTSTETALASQSASEGYTGGGLGSGSGSGAAASTPTDWRIDVSSEPCPNDRCA